jgi:hypothetical protein
MKKKPGRQPKFKHTEETGAYVLKDGKGGINWYRYKKVIIEPLLIPFAKLCKKDRTNTVVQEDGAPTHSSKYQRKVYSFHQIHRYRHRRRRRRRCPCHCRRRRHHHQSRRCHPLYYCSRVPVRHSATLRGCSKWGLSRIASHVPLVRGQAATRVNTPIVFQEGVGSIPVLDVVHLAISRILMVWETFRVLHNEPMHDIDPSPVGGEQRSVPAQAKVAVANRDLNTFE